MPKATASETGRASLTAEPGPGAPQHLTGAVAPEQPGLPCSCQVGPSPGRPRLTRREMGCSAATFFPSPQLSGTSVCPSHRAARLAIEDWVFCPFKHFPSFPPEHVYDQKALKVGTWGCGAGAPQPGSPGPPPTCPPLAGPDWAAFQPLGATDSDKPAPLRQVTRSGQARPSCLLWNGELVR